MEFPEFFLMQSGFQKWLGEMSKIQNLYGATVHIGSFVSVTEYTREDIPYLFHCLSHVDIQPQ